MLAQCLSGLSNLPLARKKDQYVAHAATGRFVHCIEDCLFEIAFLFVFIFGFILIRADRLITHFNRIHPARHFDYRRVVEMGRKALCVDGCGSNDKLQIRPPGQQLLEIAEQEIDIEATLVRLIDNDRIVGEEGRVSLGFRQQDTVGHELDISLRTDLIGKAHLVTHRLTHRTIELRCNPGRHRARRDTPRLRMPDHARYPASELEADFWQLCRLARAGLAAHNHHLIFTNRAHQLITPRNHRQVFGIIGFWQICQTPRGIHGRNG